MASPYSGGAGRRTGMWQADYLSGVGEDVNRYYDTGRNQGLAALGRAQGYLDTGLSNQTGAINTNYDAAISTLGNIPGLFQGAYDRGERAGTMYSNALGLNGAGGNADATSAFQAGPGYKWQVDQATNAAARKASALGIGGSGNTLTALATLGSNLANQEYGGWLDRLRGVDQQGQQAAQGMASGYNAMAGAQMGKGNALSGVYGQHAQGSAGLSGQEANLWQQDASNRAGAALNIGGQISQAGANAMQAGQNAAANRYQTAMQIGNLGASLLGGFAGRGGFGGGWGGGSSWGTGGLY